MMGESPRRPGELEGKPAGGGEAGNLSFIVQRGTVNGAGRRKQNTTHGRQLKFGLDAELGGALLQVAGCVLAKVPPAASIRCAGGCQCGSASPGPHQSRSELNSFHSSQILRERSVSRFSRGKPMATAKRSAPSPTSMTWPVCSITAFADQRHILDVAHAAD